MAAGMIALSLIALWAVLSLVRDYTTRKRAAGQWVWVSPQVIQHVDGGIIFPILADWGMNIMNSPEEADVILEQDANDNLIRIKRGDDHADGVLVAYKKLPQLPHKIADSIHLWDKVSANNT